MNGKNRCRILKDIRKRIAEENGIEYVTTECKYKGDCLGTCPKCESEVRYLEQELAKKRSIRKRVAISGIAAGITLAATGCTPDTVSMFKDDTLQGEPMPDIQGDMVAEYSRNDNSIPNESGVSEIVDGEIVEIIGEMPEYSGSTQGQLIGEPEPGALPLPELPEITNPYEEGETQYAYDIDKVAKIERDVLFEMLKNQNRKYIDYDWQDYITYRDWDNTYFKTDTEDIIVVYYDKDGNVTDVSKWNDNELMGDMSQ